MSNLRKITLIGLGKEKNVIKHYYKVQEREAQKTAEREERFSQLRKENLGEDYLDELDDDYEDLN